MLRKIAVLVLLVFAASAASASAAAKEQLPSGKQLGKKWRVTKTSEYRKDRIQGVDTTGLVNAYTRTYKRKVGKRREKVNVTLYYYGDAARSAATFEGMKSALPGAPVEGVPAIGEASFASTFGNDIVAVFRQGGTVGTVNVDRGKRRPTKGQVGRLGKRVAFKVAVTP